MSIRDILVTVLLGGVLTCQIIGLIRPTRVIVRDPVEVFTIGDVPVHVENIYPIPVEVQR